MTDCLKPILFKEYVFYDPKYDSYYIFEDDDRCSYWLFNKNGINSSEIWQTPGIVILYSLGMASTKDAEQWGIEVIKLNKLFKKIIMGAIDESSRYY